VLSATLVYGLFGAAFGAATGSYLACAAYRLPRRISLRGRSFCPTCKAEIPARHNLPVIGFLLLHGRTACCHTHLSRHYLVYELGCTLAGAALAASLGPIWLLVSCAALVAATVVVAGSRHAL
jgi:leader peptidase (prepilin peptidase)/N-methyltransferase